MAEREEAVYLAKLAEQAERYDEMVNEMKKVRRTQQLPGGVCVRAAWFKFCAPRPSAPVQRRPAAAGGQAGARL
jgi:hypothetical protein